MRPTAPQSTAPLKGIALMAVAMAVLPFLDVVAKILGQQGVPILQIVWARMALGCALTLPLALRLAGPRGLIPDRPMFHALRAGFLIGATGLFFWALKFLSIADALAIFFVQPLIVTALSPFILGEYVGPRRWAAVAVGAVRHTDHLTTRVWCGESRQPAGVGGRGLFGNLYADDPQNVGAFSRFGHNLSHQFGGRYFDHSVGAIGLADAQPVTMGAVWIVGVLCRLWPLSDRARL